MSNQSNQPTKAKTGDQYHVALARTYMGLQVSRADVVKQIVASKGHMLVGGTKVNGLNGIAIANIMQGYKLALADVNAGLAKGTHKASKAKGVYRVPAKATVPSESATASQEVSDA